MDGGSVTMIPAGSLKNVVACSWFRRSMSNKTLIFRYELPPKSKYQYGMAYTGRETIKQYCSLHVVNLTLKDSDVYHIYKERHENQTSELGNAFLMIAEAEQRTKLTGKAIAGIVLKIKTKTQRPPLWTILLASKTEEHPPSPKTIRPPSILKGDGAR
ncbi:hypothetical protein JD844_006111 [Phrynosoma platyrhinos]|uniref:Uncharacterized protein n=1 Tax=Phrynosoma platyrhinos TaxID=52577 RepID=A0ABQ7TPE0_PHRPL|nr:hypothetical protein JD844_006111 [Phrynosoma platyrhinos]